MNSTTNTKARILKIKLTKIPAPSPARKKNYGLNTALPFFELAKDPDSDEDTFSIKMSIDNTVSND